MSHQDTIREQFARQAIPFSEARGIADADAIKLRIEVAKAEPSSRSLDVACGPGLVVLAFAEVVGYAVGLDATHSMLDRARELQKRQGCANVEWVLGDAALLPFADSSFDIATCRFAIHHMLQPSAVLREMMRVLRPAGRLVLCDAVASDDRAKADAFNEFERMRDPSTVRFLTAGELRALLADCGLSICGEHSYRLRAEFEGIMRTSFPALGDLPRLKEMAILSAEGDRLGMQTRLDGGRVLMSYPTLVLFGVKTV